MVWWRWLWLGQPSYWLKQFTLLSSSCAGCLWCSWFALCCLVVLCCLLFLSLLFWGQGVVLVVDGQRDLGLGWYAGSQLAGLLANLAASLGWLAAVCSSLWIERVADAVYFFQAFHLFKLPLGSLFTCFACLFSWVLLAGCFLLLLGCFWLIMLLPLSLLMS